MNHRITRQLFPAVLLPALLAAILLAGCEKKADQTATSSTPSTAPSGPPADGTAMTANVTPPPAPEPAPIVVPAQTVLSVVLDQTISSKTASAGQNFSATVRTPVSIGGVIAIPRGAHVTGVINDAKAAGRFKGGASLALTLTGLNIDGRDYAIDTSTDDRTSKGKGKRTAGMVGGGGAGGALIGGIAGGGKGALIGALVGAGAGTAGSAFTGQNDIILSSETPMTFRLHQDLTLKAPPAIAPK